MHDISSPYDNIDHIVIGRGGGVHLIETKAHGGRVNYTSDEIFINGKPAAKNFISQTLQNTYWLREQIADVTGNKVWITPVIVFTNAFVPFGDPIKGVHIVNKRYLPSVFKRETRKNPGDQPAWAARERIAERLAGDP